MNNSSLFAPYSRSKDRKSTYTTDPSVCHQIDNAKGRQLKKEINNEIQKNNQRLIIKLQQIEFKKRHKANPFYLESLNIKNRVDSMTKIQHQNIQIMRRLSTQKSRYSIAEYESQHDTRMRMLSTATAKKRKWRQQSRTPSHKMHTQPAQTTQNSNTPVHFVASSSSYFPRRPNRDRESSASRSRSNHQRTSVDSNTQNIQIITSTEDGFAKREILYSQIITINNKKCHVEFSYNGDKMYYILLTEFCSQRSFKLRLVPETGLQVINSLQESSTGFQNLISKRGSLYLLTLVFHPFVRRYTFWELKRNLTAYAQLPENLQEMSNSKAAQSSSEYSSQAMPAVRTNKHVLKEEDLLYNQFQNIKTEMQDEEDSDDSRDRPPQTNSSSQNEQESSEFDKKKYIGSESDQKKSSQLSDYNNQEISSNSSEYARERLDAEVSDSNLSKVSVPDF